MPPQLGRDGGEARRSSGATHCAGGDSGGGSGGRARSHQQRRELQRLGRGQPAGGKRCSQPPPPPPAAACCLPPSASLPADLPLPSASLLQPFLEAQGIHEPTEVQSGAIPAILSGENVAVRCYTGSGALAWLQARFVGPVGSQVTLNFDSGRPSLQLVGCAVSPAALACHACELLADGRPLVVFITASLLLACPQARHSPTCCPPSRRG